MRPTIQPRLAAALTVFIALPLALSCSSAKGHRSNRPAAPETSKASGNVAGGSAPNAEASSPPSDEPVVTPATVGGPEVNALAVNVGVRNFQAINQTMSILTGVPTTDKAVAAAYAEQNSALPTETDVKTFVGSSQVAVFKLAVEYCNAMVSDKAKAAAVFGSINTTEAPSTVFSASGKKAIGEALIGSLLGDRI